MGRDMKLGLLYFEQGFTDIPYVMSLYTRTATGCRSRCGHPMRKTCCGQRYRVIKKINVYLPSLMMKVPDHLYV
jgi:hypothetical protein